MWPSCPPAGPDSALLCGAGDHVRRRPAKASAAHGTAGVSFTVQRSRPGLSAQLVLHVHLRCTAAGLTPTRPGTTSRSSQWTLAGGRRRQIVLTSRLKGCGPRSSRGFGYGQTALLLAPRPGPLRRLCLSRCATRRVRRVVTAFEREPGGTGGIGRTSDGNRTRRRPKRVGSWRPGVFRPRATRLTFMGIVRPSTDILADVHSSLAEKVHGRTVGWRRL